MSKLADKQEKDDVMSIEDLKDTLALAKKNKHKHVVKAINIQIASLEQEGKEPKQTIRQKMSSIFSKRKK